MAREASERSSKTIEGSEANSGNDQSVAEGESGLGRYGRSARSEAETGEQSGNGLSAVSDGKEVAAPSLEGAKVGVTDGEKSSATGDAVPSEEGVTDNPRQQNTVGKSAQPPTREESILRDVVIEHMNGSGLDVIGTEDGQRVLDMANDEDVRTGRVTIVLPNNKNAADVREAVLFAYGKTIACEQTQTPNVTIKRYL